MSTTPSEPSKRKWAPKSREGCRTCKSRHVRCDYKQPLCGPCKKSSRQCEYSPNSDPDPLKIVLYQPPNLHQISQQQCHTPDEIRAFGFFRTKVAVHLSGVFDSSFWTEDVLRVAQEEDSIRHAIVALASLSETLLKSEDGKPEPFAVRQYRKAVKEKSIESSAEVVLITQALFICIEMFQNNHELALSQMSSGVFSCYSSRSSRLPVQIERLFGRLMLQTILFVDTKPEEWTFIAPAFTPALPMIPSAFGSVEEARDCLDGCMCFLYHKTVTSQFQGLQMQNIQESPEAAATVGTSDPLEEWGRTFEVFKAVQEGKSSTREQCALTLLEIRHITSSILASPAPFSQESLFDAHDAAFGQIVTLSSQLLALLKETDTSPLPSFDMGILPPLYCVASRCRHPVIRRQALELLRGGPRQEAIWQRDMLLNIAERIIGLEELGLERVETSEDVPVANRVTVVNAKICKGERRVMLYCCRQQVKGQEEEEIRILTETIEY